MTKRRGLYLARVRGTKVWPKEPVPPVIKIEELVNMLRKYQLASEEKIVGSRQLAVGKFLSAEC